MGVNKSKLAPKTVVRCLGATVDQPHLIIPGGWSLPLLPPPGPGCLRTWQPETVERVCLVYLNGCWSAFVEKRENEERRKCSSYFPEPPEQFRNQGHKAPSFCPLHASFLMPSAHSPWIQDCTFCPHTQREQHSKGNTS